MALIEEKLVNLEVFERCRRGSTTLLDTKDMLARIVFAREIRASKLPKVLEIGKMIKTSRKKVAYLKEQAATKTKASKKLYRAANSKTYEAYQGKSSKDKVLAAELKVEAAKLKVDAAKIDVEVASLLKQASSSEVRILKLMKQASDLIKADAKAKAYAKAAREAEAKKAQKD